MMYISPGIEVNDEYDLAHALWVQNILLYEDPKHLRTACLDQIIEVVIRPVCETFTVAAIYTMEILQYIDNKRDSNSCLNPKKAGIRLPSSCAYIQEPEILFFVEDLDSECLRCFFAVFHTCFDTQNSKIMANPLGQEGRPK